jgi:CheY-like chemotaxis protein
MSAGTPGESAFAQQLRATRANPAHPGMRVALLTARDAMEEVQQALGPGADESLMNAIERADRVSKLALMQPDGERG